MAEKNNKYLQSLEDRYPCWKELQQHSSSLKSSGMKKLFAEDAARFQKFSIEAAGLHLDFSKNFITHETLLLFKKLTSEAKLELAINDLLSGGNVNNTENRPAWHSALRSNTPPQVVTQTLERMLQLVDDVHNGFWSGFSDKKITDVVSIGIGGSDLGPRMATTALRPYHCSDLQCHFVSNIDPSDINETLALLDPETTLFIIASKSFTTLETLSNAERAKQWFLTKGQQQHIEKHFIAVSSAIDKAGAFGIPPKNIFPMWDWVGGRYSLWSAIGLPIALAIGMKAFGELLQGAMLIDKHFAETPVLDNMPVILALLGIWYSHFWGAQTQAILPYDQHLKYFPDFLQQLEMESNGKDVDKEGNAINYSTGSIIWGSIGTNGQHSFHQLLHQGKHTVPVDFILSLTTPNTANSHDVEQHRHLVANCLGQSQALLQGKCLEDIKRELKEEGLPHDEIARLAPHKVIEGSHPNNMISFARLTPETLGALIALYEHKVYVQSVIWNTNPFDQWGVELGKQLSKPIFNALCSTQEPADSRFRVDSSTASLIQRYRNANPSTK
jgi:glucose-6-phosphate isomerase